MVLLLSKFCLFLVPNGLKLSNHSILKNTLRAYSSRDSMRDSFRDNYRSSAEPYRSTAGRSDVSTRVYVGNLSWEVGWQDLKDHMRSAGLKVVRASVMTEPGGRSKGCGIVEFSSSQDAVIAIEKLNDSELKGRPIFVREDREQGQGQGRQQVLPL